MRPILQNLIKQHYKSTGELNQATIALLEDLENALMAQESDETLQAILDAMPFGITLINFEKRIVHANRSALDLMGYSSLEEVTGHICHDTLCPASAGQCPILDLNQRVDRADRVLITKDRQKIPILKSVTPISYKGEEVLLEAFVDITEQKQTEQERTKNFEARGELARKTNNIIRDLSHADQVSQIYSGLAEQLLSLFEFDRIQYFTYNQVANNLRIVEAVGEGAEIPVAQRAILPAGVGAVGKVVSTRGIVTASEDDLALEQFPQMVSNLTQGQVALPIFGTDELLGVLDVQVFDPEGITPDVMLFLETLTIQAGIMTEAIRNRSEMLEQFDELTTLQRRTSVEGWLEFIETNPLIASKYIFDQNLDSAVPILEQPNEENGRKPVVSNPLKVRGSIIGALGIADNPEQPLTPEEVQLLESVSEEVAEALERARLFESSQRSASELAVLNEMGATFAQANNEESINDTVYTYTAKLMKAPQFFIAYYDVGKDEISFPYVVMDGERVVEGHPGYESFQPRPVGSGLTGYMINHRLPILIDSDAEETLNKLGIPFMQFGGETQSFLGVPMVLGDRTIGVICVQSEEVANLYSRHHLDLLTTIASQAAVSINNTRLFHTEQERAQQERTVRTITDKVRRGANTQAIMQIALEELSKVLDADLSTIQLGKPEQLVQGEEQSVIEDIETDINNDEALEEGS